MGFETLAMIWFLLIGILLIGYAILDGFDLGVGILHYTARDDRERRIFMNSIGPLWDGNEVWLVTFGGALFAAFPTVYATVFSGFYIAFMLLLFCLIFRAVSLEFRGKVKSAGWRRVWDFGFFASSLGATLLFGVAVGNAMIGLPIGADLEMRATLLEQLGVYPLAVGVLAVALFAMHGAIYLYLKTEGEVQERLKPVMWRTFGFFLVMYMLVTIMTLVMVPEAVANFRRWPWLWIVPVLNVLAIANIPRAIYKEKPGYAFISSTCTIAALAFLFMAGLFPNLVRSSLGPEYSLTYLTGASSRDTLWNMFIIACLGLPFVFAYTAVIYWTFWGKVKLGEHSY